MLILNIANISAFSNPSAFSISDRTTTRRVVKSEAELMALMRALKIRSGTGETLASISWPIRTCAISCSKIWAFNHIVERSAIVYSASPDGAADRRRDRGHAAERTGLLELQDFLIGAAENPQPDARGFERRVGRPQVIFGSRELRLGLLHILERGGLAFVQTANAILEDLRQIVLGARFAFCGLGRDEVVLLDELLGAVDFQQRIAPLDLIAEPGNQTGNPAGEGRQNDRAGILIVSDLTDRRGLRAERISPDLHDLQLMHLIRDDTQKVRPLHRAFGHGERCHHHPTEQRGKQSQQKRLRGH